VAVMRLYRLLVRPLGQRCDCRRDGPLKHFSRWFPA